MGKRWGLKRLEAETAAGRFMAMKAVNAWHD